jgi:D-beta-D-heptose 7-phosphate kinase/D-beta-D-heptose 1-phosphate adenosyltransferase
MTIVFTNGVFDLFHVGHLKVLYEASKLGDELHVGINSDASVRRLKGSTRPIYNQDHRFEIVSAIRYVNRVYIFDEDTPKKLIEKILPDIVVKGGDYRPQDVVGAHVAKVVIVPLLQDNSTTETIRRINESL